MKIKVFTAFSGYDSQCMALDRLARIHKDFSYELVGWSEIDKHAIQAHNAVYPQWADRNYGDISKIDWAQVPDFDLFTYSFPCQDISNAGVQRGFEEGTGTRSSLLWECRKAIEIKRPKYLLMENVQALLGDRFIKGIQKWFTVLEGMGYRNWGQVLNAKDYGVPQNRPRVFLVSILGGGSFEFPKPMELKYEIKDKIEQNVDDSYFLTDDKVQQMIMHCDRKQKEGCGFKFEPTNGGGVAKTITSKSGQRETDNYLIDNNGLKTR